MGYGVGIAIALAESMVQGDFDHGVAADAVHQQQLLDEYGVPLYQRADLERIEDRPGIRRKLDPGPDFTKLGRLFEHGHAKPLDGERERSGKAADSAARDDHRYFVPNFH